MLPLRYIFFLGLAAAGLTFGPAAAVRMPAFAQLQEFNEIDSGTGIYIGPGALAAIQDKLAREIKVELAVDGMWGPATAKAVRSFQQAKGVAPTGRIDLETIHAMGLPKLLTGESMRHTKASSASASGGGARLFLGPQALGRIQRNLRQQGYEIDSVDGLWGAQTRSAVAAFQKSKGLDPTGAIDLELIETLGLRNALFEADAPLVLSGLNGLPDLRPASKIAAPENAAGGAPLWIGPSSVRRLQRMLALHGLDPGEIDGVWGGKTSRAVSQFQQSRGLDVTGNITLSTLGVLAGGLDFRMQAREIGAALVKQEAQPNR